ncbi:hypothetical protein IscW_ISCW006905 [Ixodes scapularis]|uniref:Uncharacterized protein n=1 Tax=Ixodes scapularis TaxID=6945 RepID=B7PVJ2_IXOSC|nr:hypothetical protein IscW_ISCW006905 [Ixodes scapularis]|eukprot:XP_002408113.1 hypothetical protein IscW_ISCW006905 [Ixodes scapularis]
MPASSFWKRAKRTKAGRLRAESASTRAESNNPIEAGRHHALDALSHTRLRRKSNNSSHKVKSAELD